MEPAPSEYNKKRQRDVGRCFVYSDHCKGFSCATLFTTFCLLFWSFLFFAMENHALGVLSLATAVLSLSLLHLSSQNVIELGSAYACFFYWTDQQTHIFCICSFYFYYSHCPHHRRDKFTFQASPPNSSALFVQTPLPYGIVYCLHVSRSLLSTHT